MVVCYKQTAMAKKQLPLLLLDVDGVIVDSFDSLYQAIASYIRENKGKELTVEEYRAAFEGNALSTLMKRAGFAAYSNATSWQHTVSMLFHDYQDAPIFEDILPTLQSLAKTHTLVVITSSPVEIVQLRFEKEGITGLFAAYLGPEVSVFKDEKIKVALEEFGAKPEKTFFVSDTSGDIIEAKKAGVKTVAVTWGYHAAETLVKVDPDKIVQTPRELLSFLTDNRYV